MFKKYYIKHKKKNRKRKNKTRDGDPPPSTPQREAVEGGSTFAHPWGVEDPPPVPLLWGGRGWSHPPLSPSEEVEGWWWGGSLTFFYWFCRSFFLNFLGIMAYVAGWHGFTCTCHIFIGFTWKIYTIIFIRNSGIQLFQRQNSKTFDTISLNYLWKPHYVKLFKDIDKHSKWD